MIKEKIKYLKNKLKRENKRSYFAIAILLVVLVISLSMLVIKDTHAYYNYEMAPVPIFTSKVGNFAGEGESVKTGPLTDKDTDVNIIFYTQMPDNADKYKESKYVPASGYKINHEKSNCYPAYGGDVTYQDNKYYTIKEDGTVHIEYNEIKPTQVVCRLYYDRDKLSDVIIYAYIEDETGDRKYGDKTYKLNNSVQSGYSMTTYECKSKTAKTTFTYDTNGFHIDTIGPDTCYAYFSKS